MSPSEESGPAAGEIHAVRDEERSSVETPPDPRRMEAWVGRFGAATLGVLWIEGARGWLHAGSAMGTGMARSHVPFFENAHLVSTTYLVLAVALVLGALLLRRRHLAHALTAWTSAQAVHLAYHLYDIDIVAPAERSRLFGGFAASLAVAVALIVLLHRSAREPATRPVHP
ncbi:hypothetical protein M2164_000669 [Streptomyces sp. SAI-208]|jgi:hypothetical protein|uniref:hypothetical protein n=1 Tax=unclassified Streptomyces TaxID=2593676 RepID=UPI002474BFAF|nr:MULTISPECIES: hypothetical protein [unclassified Streptomyces]MDH6514193.1 hypothetical protein [Streptomyces sp. SAI-090]MDH6546372.1 hypothetical protein [Streptomyces sp. SAI-041]MDH6565471.1 hypothetical protein [Streptomyces sp. SAI-117]MDH6589612.1 hypothetical protein [Streptomyces sp. SAI-133]MDH6605034.1 hypothetical protein [Streptomyces sp. SAI-208]